VLWILCAVVHNNPINHIDPLGLTVIDLSDPPPPPPPPEKKPFNVEFTMAATAKLPDRSGESAPLNHSRSPIQESPPENRPSDRELKLANDPLNARVQYLAALQEQERAADAAWQATSTGDKLLSTFAPAAYHAKEGRADLAALDVLMMLFPMKMGATPRAARNVANPVPSALARIVDARFVNSPSLGALGAEDVFVTAANDIRGITTSQGLANRLTMLDNAGNLRQGPFGVIQFDTPSRGIASPVFRSNPGFIQGGLTGGGAREFVLPNMQLDQLQNVTTRIIP